MSIMHTRSWFICLVAALCVLVAGTNDPAAQQNASDQHQIGAESSAPTNRSPTSRSNCFDAGKCQPEDGGKISADTTFDASDPSRASQSSRLAPDGGIKGKFDPQAGATAAADLTRYIEAVCLAVAREAIANKIPAVFFARLIWQESRFNPSAQSYKGAQGIAQFMPATARSRGLANSFEPFGAVHHSAQWLAELRDQFGNLGLAAAAYNAGPSRVQSWLWGHASLPYETERYVRIVTGHSAGEWLHSDFKEDDEKPSFKFIPCNEIAKSMARRKLVRG